MAFRCRQERAALLHRHREAHGALRLVLLPAVPLPGAVQCTGAGRGEGRGVPDVRAGDPGGVHQEGGEPRPPGVAGHAWKAVLEAERFPFWTYFCLTQNRTFLGKKQGFPGQGRFLI